MATIDPETRKVEAGITMNMAHEFPEHEPSWVILMVSSANSRVSIWQSSLVASKGLRTGTKAQDVENMINRENIKQRIPLFRVFISF